MTDIVCQQCGHKLGSKSENGIIHFSHRVSHGGRFEYLASPGDNAKAKCPKCETWHGIWEITQTKVLDFVK